MNHRLIKEKQLFMNTQVEFSAWTNLEREKVSHLFALGFKQFHHVVDKFSRFKNDSELTLLNQANGKETKVSEEYFRLVDFAIKMADRTGGAYDPTVIDFLQTYGYDAKYNFKRLKNRELILQEVKQLVKKRASYKDIKLNRKELTITMHPSQRLDLGSIGKGYAVDLAYKKLLPLRNFVINAGGDIRAEGVDRTKNPWLVEINVPKFKSLGNIQLKDQAVCSSGSWARKVKFFHHLINPQTGKPQNELISVFVIAETAMKADAWATALYALGEKAEKYISKYKLKALLVTKDKEIRNSNFQITRSK